MKRPWIMLALGGLVSWTAACGSEDPGALPATGDAVDVRVSRAVLAPAVESFPATLRAESRARIATRTSGRIREVPVDVGSPIRAGQPLVVLEADDVEARLASARAQATLAERSFQRVENLARDGAASEQELDEARARLAAARAAVQEVETQLAYVVVRAPFDGYVQSRSADPGDLTAPGQTLLTVVGREGLEVEADLPSGIMGWVAEGDEVRVRIPDADVVARARVTRVAPALETGSRRVRVQAVFLDPPAVGGALIPGAYARLEVERPGSGSAWIPEDALIRRGQLTGVFTVEDGALRLRWLRTGRATGDAVEVLAGPGGVLTVVREPGSVLRDGQPVGAVREVAWSHPGGGA